MWEHYVVQLSRDLQRATERSLDLERQVSELDQQNSAEVVSLQRQLISELSVCAIELDAVVSVCVQVANGDEPNLSCVLGMPRKSTSKFIT